MAKFYISAAYDIGQLSYSSKQPDGTHRTYIEANNEKDAIAQFKDYIEKSPFNVGGNPLTLLINSETMAVPRLLDYETEELIEAFYKR
jgi:hypothetical protein